MYLGNQMDLGNSGSRQRWMSIEYLFQISNQQRMIREFSKILNSYHTAKALFAAYKPLYKQPSLYILCKTLSTLSWALAREASDLTCTLLRTPKTLETCRKKHTMFYIKSFKVCGRSHV